ncbi:MAG TPA: N-acetyltransferase [Spirochaetota bacterium]|nr:N-acetyltransferase [Spirochaetota bacterium]
MNTSIRTANEGDVENIFSLISHYAAEGVILERGRDDIRENLENFLVAEADGKFAGTVTRYDYGETLKEVRSLAVHMDFQGLGIGRALVQKLIADTEPLEGKRIFTLTYKPGFFARNGFRVVPKDNFPEKIWKDCVNCRDREKCGETALIYQG